jgi:hypothetical protein
MRKVLFGVSALVALTTITGCTDATTAKWSALGGTGNIRCYSGDMLIYEGSSTGKISNSSQSDGYYFVDRKTAKLVEVSGNCVITYESY